MTYGTELRPLRKVVKSIVMSGRGSILGPDTDRRTCWYEMTLDCGHIVQRTVKYKPQLHLPEWRRRRGRVRHRGAHEALPAPKRARCDYCQKRSQFL